MSLKKCIVCKFNQTGFCKFKEHCRNEHNNETCENLSECTDGTCTKRHPKVCRNFTEDKKCRYKEKCAYLHIEKVNNQNKVNEAMTLLVLKHEKDIAALTEEVNTLKTLVESMALQFSSEEENMKFASSETKYECKVCNFKSEKQITLNKHMNTKHVQDSSKSKEMKANVKSVKNNSCKTQFYCDECDFSSTNKKSLKKHMDKGIHTEKNSDISVEEVNNDIVNAKNVPNSNCDKCSKEEACEDCIEAELDEWIAKGNGLVN
jgi:hypothetical protein